MDAMLEQERKLDKIGGATTDGKPDKRVRVTATRAARRADRKALKQEWAEYLAGGEGGSDERLQ